MSKSYHPAIRAYLRTVEDGATTTAVAAEIETSEDTARQALHAMPDVYIDRWAPVRSGYVAVWCAVEVPEDCPRPEVAA